MTTDLTAIFLDATIELARRLEGEKEKHRATLLRLRAEELKRSEDARASTEITNTWSKDYAALRKQLDALKKLVREFFEIDPAEEVERWQSVSDKLIVLAEPEGE